MTIDPGVVLVRIGLALVFGIVIKEPGVYDVDVRHLGLEED